MIHSYIYIYICRLHERTTSLLHVETEEEEEESVGVYACIYARIYLNLLYVCIHKCAQSFGCSPASQGHMGLT